MGNRTERGEGRLSTRAPRHRMYERIETKDGSVTYRNTVVGATYRSVNGARSESKHVFLEGTRLSDRPDCWRVLELGFGTGLNFSVTLEKALVEGVNLEYVSLEPNPLPPELWLTPEEWRQPPGSEHIQGGVSLTVLPARWQEFSPKTESFHAVYHDPFGPGQAPECWEEACFRWSYEALTRDGILATFGASGAARRAMKRAGFFVGSAPGALGKREMTVASPTERPIEFAKPWKRNP